MHRIKYSKSSLVESGGILMIKNGLSVLLPLKSPKGLVVERMVVSDVAAAAAMGGSRRFFNTGGITTESSSSSLMKRDDVLFRAGDISNLFRGQQQTGGCVGSFVPHQCNKNHMLPYFARRALASSSASQSSGQTQRQEPEKKKRECQIKTSSELQRERRDEISSTKVSLNQFPGLMVYGIVDGIVDDSETRRLLRLNPDTGYFEEEEQEQDVSAAASTHHGHYELQVPHRHSCRGSAYGWLFLTDDNCDVKLLNPFSGAEIQLPSVNTLPPAVESWFDRCKWSVTKAVFSANPSIEPRPVVLIIYGGQYWPKLAFCKPGDKGWTPLEFPAERSFHVVHVDAIYHKGQFYVLGYGGYVFALDIGRRIDDHDHSVKTILIANRQDRDTELRDWYLMVMDGELVSFEIIRRFTNSTKMDYDTSDEDCINEESHMDYDTSDEDCINDTSDEDCINEESHMDYDTSDEDCINEESHDDDDGKKEFVDLRPPYPRTLGIKIRRFDASEKQWVKVESLGDKAVFLGLNTSFALSASDYPAGLCIPDSVYFTGGGGIFHCVEADEYDSGIYNVKNKSVKPLYPEMVFEPEFTKPAPMWIVNPLSS